MIFGLKITSLQVVADRGPHSLHGKNIDPKRAQPKGALEGVNKLFVGGLDPEITEDQVRTHFGQFGKVSYNLVLHSSSVIVSKQTNGFVHFRS